MKINIYCDHFSRRCQFEIKEVSIFAEKIRMHDEAIKLGFSEKVGNIGSSNWHKMLCKREEVSFLQQLSVNIRYLLSLLFFLFPC